MTHPENGTIQGKIWGQTAKVFAFNGVSAHWIKVKRGGFCSKHTHEHKWNRFVVLSGRLSVKIWQNGTPDETIIEEGGVTDVPPGVRHEFEALTDVVALEFYFTILADEDIDRHGTVGGVRE
ncbi:MAG: cupin domain-containing protein [Bacteroidales bacterium]|jgi:mannose-6-phosphate isomerase-like protein (cupin superfamily)